MPGGDPGYCSLRPSASLVFGIDYLWEIILVLVVIDLRGGFLLLPVLLGWDPFFEF